jgi:hypothetical protein
MNQFHPRVEQGSFSVMEFAVYCPALAQLPQLRGCRSILSSTYERKLALHPDAKWDPEAFG